MIHYMPHWLFTCAISCPMYAHRRSLNIHCMLFLSFYSNSLWGTFDLIYMLLCAIEMEWNPPTLHTYGGKFKNFETSVPPSSQLRKVNYKCIIS